MTWFQLISILFLRSILIIRSPNYSQYHKANLSFRLISNSIISIRHCNWEIVLHLWWSVGPMISIWFLSHSLGVRRWNMPMGLLISRECNWGWVCRGRNDPGHPSLGRRCPLWGRWLRIDGDESLRGRGGV